MQHLLSQGEISHDFIVYVEIKENLSDEKILRIAAIENVKRENLTLLEEFITISTLVQNRKKVRRNSSKDWIKSWVIRRRLALLNLTENAKAT